MGCPSQRVTPVLPVASREAARIVADARALLITAGAGMGVDSGLPDFRGPEGFWRAYPAFRRLGLDFVSLATDKCKALSPKGL